MLAVRTRLELRNIRSASERVQNYLALNTGADGSTIDLKGTVKDLAAELGLSHEVLYRTLHRLESDGKIERVRGKILLNRPNAI